MSGYKIGLTVSIVAMLISLIGMIVFAASKTCTLQEFAFDDVARKSSWQNMILNRGSSDKDSTQFLSGFGFTTPSREILIPNIDLTDSISDQIPDDPVLDKSFSIADLKKQADGKQPMAMLCSSAFGCAREYLEVDVTGFKLGSAANNTKTAVATVGGKEFTFDFSSFLSDNTADYNNPFGFAFLSETAKGTNNLFVDSMTKCQDKTTLYPGDILVDAGGNSPKKLSGMDSVSSVSKISIMRICKINSDLEGTSGGPTFQTYNFNTGDNKFIYNIPPQSLYAAGKTKVSVDTITGMPYLDASVVKAKTGVDANLKGDNETNLNNEFTRVKYSTETFQKLFIYKAQLTGGKTNENIHLASNVQDLISSLSDSKQIAKNWNFGGVGSSLPLVYDKVYTSDEIANFPLFKGAKVNLYDPCRLNYLSAKNVLFPGLSFCCCIFFFTVFNAPRNNDLPCASPSLGRPADCFESGLAVCRRPAARAAM